ncbi:hypothetical protein ARAM_004348 [Aspergillus rambellii]|uniref:Aflatoxin regulatory protein domain-containing protein n=1 Tax=Aspergillus rambellii TaxID=308745 RepID=A0A0F8VFG7_9EURO|nr:hypothetical protein ARAM_004348 [Aspergillus rambellii]
MRWIPICTGMMADLSVADAASASFMQDITGTAALSSGSSFPNTHPCCLTICLEILMRLFPNAPVGCQRPGSEDEPSKLCTIESVIADNKQIMDTIQTVLECRCAQDEYVVTLVSLIVLKVMGWYVAAARDRPSGAVRDGGMDWEGGLHSRRPSSSSFDEEVLHLPTIIGGYCIDGHHQSRMAAQLVLSELHRVQRLLGRSSVLDSGGPLPMLPGPGISPLSSNTLSHLEDDLRRRFRAVSSETIEILRRA